MICLPPQLVKVFLKKLTSLEIQPDKLTRMTSAERRAFFTDFLGETHAKNVNALFESKLLLKNQQQGIINWAKNVGGLKPEVQRDILSRVQRMTQVLQPKEVDAFLNDLAAQRLGINVTLAEANKIAELAKAVAEKKTQITDQTTRLEYGRARVEFSNYVNSLKEEAAKTTFLEKLRNPVGALSETAGVAKSIKASMDNSAIFRQGWKTLWTNPGIWLKNAKQSFFDIVRTFGAKPVMDELMADIVSRPNYDLMRKAKLAIGNIEEAYPSHLPEKVPLLGRAYKASENAFTAFVYRQRADIFDKYIQIAKRSGIDINDKTQLQSIGKLVNSLTGRGSMGVSDRTLGVINNIFFSPRFIKSHIDVLTAHLTDKNVTAFAKKQAAINLLKIVSGTAGVLVVANAIAPGSVEKDPRSSDFGKIKIRDTRFEVTGGMASLVTLAFRLIQMSTKSSTTGKVTPLNAKDKKSQPAYAAQTGTDVVYNFFENKLAPAATLVKDLLKDQDFQGKKPTILGEASNLFMPLPVTTYQELRSDPNSANTLLAMIADALGIGTNTYPPKQSK